MIKKGKKKGGKNKIAKCTKRITKKYEQRAKETPARIKTKHPHG